MSERGNGILRFLDYWLGIPLCLLTSFLRKLKKHSVAKNMDKIAILCQGAIGDLLLLSALIYSLHKKFPFLKIDLFLSKANDQGAALLPYIHSAKSFSVKRPLELIFQLRKEKYDILMDASTWTRIGAIISNCSGAKYTIGFKSPGQMRHYGYDKIIPHSASIHEKDNFMALGQSLWKDLQSECTLIIPEQKELSKTLIDKSYICLHMWPSGIKSWLKEWPEKNWRELSERLLQGGYKLFLTGSTADKEKSERFIKENFIESANIKSFAGRYNLMETALILSRAKALISVNTGIMHLGALVGVPTIALHGPTNPKRWGPLGKRSISLLPKEGKNAYLDLGFEYPKHAENTMGLISVSEVIQALQKLNVKI